MRKILGKILLCAVLMTQGMNGAFLCSWEKCCEQGQGLLGEFCQAGVGECVEFDCTKRPVVTSTASAPVMSTPSTISTSLKLPVMPSVSGETVCLPAESIKKLDESLKDVEGRMALVRQKMDEVRSAVDGNKKPEEVVKLPTP